MPEADAEGRDLARDLAEGLDHRLHHRRVAGAVRDEQAVRPQGADVGRRRGVGQEVDIAVALHQVAVDVALGAAVDGGDLEARTRGPTARSRLGLHEQPAAGRPLPERLLVASAAARRHLRGEVGTGHRGNRPRAGHEVKVGRIRERNRGNHAAHRPAHAEATDQGARIDAFDRGDSRVRQPVGQATGGALVRHDRRQLAHHEAGDAGRRALDVLGGHAVVAHLGGGHGQDLARVGQVRERLLVAAHGGVEHDLARAFEVLEGTTERATVEDRPVLKGEASQFRRGHSPEV